MTEATTPKAKTEVETISMKDGRLVDFAGKRKLLKSSFVEGDALKVRLDFRNGETRTFTLPPALVSQFALHGAEQKLGDQIAGLDAIDDAVIAMDELIDQLYEGIWAQKRESSGFAGTSVLLRALAEVTGKSADELKAWLKNKTQAEKTALRNSPRVKPVVERLEAEKASKGSGVNTDALLGELGAA